MYSIVFGLVLATTATAPAANLPTWQADYRQAKVLAARDSKPLAVVIGSGSATWDSVISGQLSDQAAQTLRSGYVCVFVDVNSEAGKKLASAFEAGSTPTLILSDRTGEVQAYRHVGAIEADKVATVLTRYAEPNRAVTTTENGNAAPAVVAPIQRTSMYYPVSTGGCPNCR